MTINEKRKLMGTVVRATAQLVASRTRHHPRGMARTIIRMELKTPVVGWVTGFSTRNEGVIESDSEDCTYFTATRGVPCVLIRTWVRAREIAVPLDAIEPASECEIRSPYKWRDDWRFARDEVSASCCPKCGRFRRGYEGHWDRCLKCGYDERQEAER